MSLVHPKPPADGLRIVVEVLQQFYDDSTLLESTPLACVDPDHLDAAEPHRRYTIGLRVLAGGGFLDQAVAHGWRYILLAGEEAVGELELSEEAADGSLYFHSLTMGRIPAGCLAAHVVAEGLPQMQRATFELRLLESPSLPFCALWLHAASGDVDDLFVPVSPLNLGLDLKRGYTAAELQPILQPKAKLTVKLHAMTLEKLGIVLPRPPMDDFKLGGESAAGAS